MKVIKSNQSILCGFNKCQQKTHETTTSIGRTISFETKIAPERYVCACISEK